jgi:hypothetical protein
VSHLWAALGLLKGLFSFLNKLLTRLDQERLKQAGKDELLAAQAAEEDAIREKATKARERQRLADRAADDPRLHDDGFRRR